MTCGDGKTCSAGACVVDPSVCSPLTCSGCCAGNTCTTDQSWTSCGTGGVTCQVCEPLALCTAQATCANEQWAADAILDVYIDEIRVSEAQCSDPTSAPDPQIMFFVGDKTSTSTKCQDNDTCTFTPSWKIPSVPYQQFTLGLVTFSVNDDDGVTSAPCWGGTMPSPTRDLSTKTLTSGDGKLTYHVRPAGL